MVLRYAKFSAMPRTSERKH